VCGNHSAALGLRRLSSELRRPGSGALHVFPSEVASATGTAAGRTLVSQPADFTFIRSATAMLHLTVKRCRLPLVTGPPAAARSRLLRRWVSLCIQPDRVHTGSTKEKPDVGAIYAVELVFNLQSGPGSRRVGPASTWGCYLPVVSASLRWRLLSQPGTLLPILWNCRGRWVRHGAAFLPAASRAAATVI